MNRELIGKVRDAIAANAKVGIVTGFDMSEWGFEEDEEGCGTAACIAGYTAAISGDSSDSVGSWGIVAKHFEIGWNEAYKLCIPDVPDWIVSKIDITNDQAAAMLDWLLDHANCPDASEITAKWRELTKENVT